MHKILLMISGFFGASAVSLGSFAAHGLKKYLTVNQIAVFQTGVHYQIIHTLALLAVILLMFYLKTNWLKISAWLFICGILLFSGSLYLLVLWKIPVGIITPIGGMCLILAWLCLILVAFKFDKKPI